MRAGGPHCAAFAIISIRRREEIGPDCRKADGEPHVIASRCAQRRGVVQPAFVTQMGMRKLPLVLVVQLPSKLYGTEDPSHRGNVLGFLSGKVPVQGVGRGATRSGAPVELVQRPRISLPLAQLWIGPLAALAAGQVHAGKLECGLGSGAFHPRPLSGLIL